MKQGKAKAPEFETSLVELEAIVRQLEEEETPLAKSLELFARGQELARRCETELREAENQVRVLMEGPGGEISEVVFEGGGEGQGAAEEIAEDEPEAETPAPKTPAAKAAVVEDDLPF